MASRGETRDDGAPQAWLGYAIAGLGIALVTVVKLIDPTLGRFAPLSFFVLPVMGAAWFGGIGPALTAVALGAIAADYFFIVDPPAVVFSPHAFILVASFVLEGL